MPRLDTPAALWVLGMLRASSAPADETVNPPLAKNGMTPARALMAGTANSADLLGIAVGGRQ
jgi:hypothetical protein